jgi:hypothetical protein
MAQKMVDSIVVRMYRIGTGDCFLLKFRSGNEVTFTMLIDCGSCKGDRDVFTPFAQQIFDEVAGHLNLLVITHEHLDHIIGFARAREVFMQLQIDHVWVAWTEDPSNELADRLREQYGKEVRALAKAVHEMNDRLQKLNMPGAASGEFGIIEYLGAQERFLEGLRDQLGLYYSPEDPEFAASGGTSEMCNAMRFVMEDVKKKTGEEPYYCYPGKPVPNLSGTTGVRFYVLGPPESEEMLKKEEVAGEVYQRKTACRPNADFVAALGPRMGEPAELAPFSNNYILTDPIDRASYAREHLNGPDNVWRGIDIDWLNSAGDLAIRLEKYMNNTCLVLAIELTKSGKVLLFPGDAQSGNWMSWHDPKNKWAIEERGKRKIVTAKDLLERTVFYKVGHHLSHNGTASKSGLDQMESTELVAFASLDYKNINSGWKSTMPAPGVLKELVRRAKGRIFRIDTTLTNEAGAEAERRKMTQEELARFEASHKITPQYIEYTVEA